MDTQVKSITERKNCSIIKASGGNMHGLYEKEQGN